MLRRLVECSWHEAAYRLYNSLSGHTRPSPRICLVLAGCHTPEGSVCSHVTSCQQLMSILLKHGRITSETHELVKEFVATHNDTSIVTKGKASCKNGKSDILPMGQLLALAFIIPSCFNSSTAKHSLPATL